MGKRVVDAQFCPGYCVYFHFWVLGPFVASFEFGPRILSFRYFILSSLLSRFVLVIYSVLIIVLCLIVIYVYMFFVKSCCVILFSISHD